ncbi:MAG: DUF4138 domain-containing protein [Bacteroidota bacterium]|nr:DUF4138 domain-containing protein [Bacteroidota bacterium]
MKQFVCLISASWLFVSAMAQTSLCITTDKTTSLVFPFAIRHVDRGTKSVLAEPVKEAPNILLIKAASKNFPETNLSVITDDGSVYSFAVCYESSPSIWVYKLPVNQKPTVSTYANAILDNGQTMYGINDRKDNMIAEIAGIYIKGDVLFYQLRLTNRSHVDFDIDQLRFYIRDKKKNKRTAIQENELKPLYAAGNASQVKAHRTTVIALALDKFTIPDSKYLAIQITEKNGGRHLFIKIKNSKIMKATELPDLK